MKIGETIVEKSLRHHLLVTGLMVLATVVLGLLIPAVKVDTDPENMLSPNEAVRVFHNDMKKVFDLQDMVVLGVVNEKDPDGVFNPQSLSRIYELTQFAINELQCPVPETGESTVLQLLGRRYTAAAQWVAGEKNEPPPLESPLVQTNMIAPSLVDNIIPEVSPGPGKPGTVRLDWLMKEPPRTREEAVAIREQIVQRVGTPEAYTRNPLLYGTMVSEDGRAITIYLPLKSKDLSHDVYVALQEKIAGFTGDEKYYITGLPVAEDTFGVEMFKQMAISAPLAMMVIFLLMLFFFRKLILIISPMIVAMVSVITTMGLLIGTGNTVHIMSSMIPIFIMPIAVLDSIHILSEFFEKYQETRDRKETMRRVMADLFQPMLYTSLTSTAGFLSLALTPIPPVQVFGIFVAVGVMIAWVLTVTFIPAYVMFIPDRWLQDFGSRHHTEEEPSSRLARFLAWVGGLTYRRAPVILGLTVAVAIWAAWGITRIQINDNPVKWFEESHPIREADTELNKHFAGTYMAYLVLKPEPRIPTGPEVAKQLETSLPAEGKRLEAAGLAQAPKAFDDLAAYVKTLPTDQLSAEDVISKAVAYATQKTDAAADAQEDPLWDAWNAANAAPDEILLGFTKPMIDPALLGYVARLQEALAETKIVGKSSSVVDVVRTVHRDMYDGRHEEFRIPDSRRGVTNVLSQFQSGHRPRDLFHLITEDYRQANLWVQLHSGDNRDMQKVVEAVDDFVKKNPPPMPLRYARGELALPARWTPVEEAALTQPLAATTESRATAVAEAAAAEEESTPGQQAGWFGLTYINVVWQSKMVSGMLLSFLGSFLVVFVMMVVLFRSALWGLLSMIPLTVTIGLIYGMVGWLGIDYDMPIAVLSSLTLGLAVDFAIHFLSRARAMHAEHGSWRATAGPVFGEPARAITRNIIVIAVGFLPLLLAPLVPYQTVGIFLATILAVSGVGTLLILPALIRVLEPVLFRERTHPIVCYCGTCIVAAVAAVAVILVNVYQYLDVGITSLTWMAVVVVPLIVLVCRIVSRRGPCAVAATETRKEISND